MTRLWDKGGSLDGRVLGYTAGDDHALDDRLVAYDIRASIAHAEMLAEKDLLSASDLASIRTALEAIGAEQLVLGSAEAVEQQVLVRPIQIGIG